MPNQFSRLASRIEKLDRELEQTANDAVEDGLETTKREAKRELASSETNWRGTLSRSITVTSVEGGHTLVVGAPHGAYVELGTGPQFGSSPQPLPEDPPRPFKAPTFSEELAENIQHWVDTKPVIPRNPSYDRDELGAAIAKHISYAGTSPQPFVRPAWMKTKTDLRRGVRAAIRRELRHV